MTERAETNPVRRRRSWTFGLRAKLMLSHLAVIAAAMTVAGVALLSLVRNYLLDATQASLDTQADLIVAALFSSADVEVQPAPPDPAFNALQQQQIANLAVQVENQPPAAEEMAAGESAVPFLANTASIELTNELPTHVLLLDNTGSPLFESRAPGPAGLARSAAVQSALAGEASRSLLRGEDGDWLAMAYPLQREGELVGGLALAHPLSDVTTVLNDLRSRLLLAAGVAAIASGLLGLILARRLVRPIGQLTTAARRLGDRDYAHPLPPGGGDEIGSLSQTFARMRDALQRTERTRTQFIGDVSHELRTPLTGIKGLVETLQDGAVDDPEVRDRFLASIATETDRLIRMTEDLLTLTRADEHALELNLEPYDLGELVKGSLDRVRQEADRLGIRLELALPQVPIAVRADPDRLEQVLLNLLDNALKHAPSGTPLEVQIAPISALERVALHSMREEGSAPGLADPVVSDRWALVRIRDQGPGIPPESLERVFDRFYRADPARDRDRGGSGLGLSIARALIELHGGQLWVESPLPEWGGDGPPGTQACFTLPCR